MEPSEEEYLEDQRKAMEEERSENEFFLKCLKMAHNYGLQHEFLDGFFHYLRGGDSITMAANCAMYDWDM